MRKNMRKITRRKRFIKNKSIENYLLNKVMTPSIDNCQAMSIQHDQSITELKKNITHFQNNRVYVTRKTRILAEERLNSLNFHSIITINLYTFSLICISVLSLIFKTEILFGVWNLFFSIALFGISLFITLFGFREKAIAFKNSHLKMYEIENSLSLILLNDNISFDEATRLYKSCQKEYIDVLDKTDNHLNRDYLKYLVVVSRKATQKDKIKYYSILIFSTLLWTVIYLIPIASVIFFSVNLLKGM